MARFSKTLLAVAVAALLVCAASAVTVNNLADCQKVYECQALRSMTFNASASTKCQCCADENDAVNRGCVTADLKCSMYCASCTESGTCASCDPGYKVDATGYKCEATDEPSVSPTSTSAAPGPAPSTTSAAPGPAPSTTSAAPGPVPSTAAPTGCAVFNCNECEAQDANRCRRCAKGTRLDRKSGTCVSKNGAAASATCVSLFGAATVVAAVMAL